MIRSARLLPAAALLLLAGCTSTAQNPQYASGPVVTTAAPPPVQTAQLAPREQTALAQAMTDISGFIDPAGYKLMSSRDQLEASGAQFNALEYGRPGAPRSWQGDSAHSGQVTVGPDLLVNNTRCRLFTHTVTVDGKPYVRKGQACREQAAGWMVTNSTVG